ncbi:unnamed protein product, partial [Staurois parvus]
KHNTVQTNPTNHPQITVHTSKRRQAGRVNINWAGRYRGSKRRMVGVTGQVQQVASSVVQRVRQRDGQGHKPGSEQEKSAAVQIRQGQQRNRNRMQDRYRAQDKHNTKAESVGLA